MQRWELELGLPVRRPQGKDRQIVLAVPEELDRWLRTQSRRTEIHSDTATAETHARLARFRELVKTVHEQMDEVMARTHALQQLAGAAPDRSGDERRDPTFSRTDGDFA